MERKTTLMNYLTTGISIVFLLLVNSCSTTIDRFSTVEFVYINDTGIGMILEVYNRHDEKFKEYSLAVSDSLGITLSGDPVVKPWFFKPNTHMMGDSIIVRFDDNRCLTYVEE